MGKLTREFYERDTLRVAPELLGKLLMHHSPDGKTVGKIVEVEVYRTHAKTPLQACQPIQTEQADPNQSL